MRLSALNTVPVLAHPKTSLRGRIWGNQRYCFHGAVRKESDVHLVAYTYTHIYSLIDVLRKEKSAKASSSLIATNCCVIIRTSLPS